MKNITLWILTVASFLTPFMGSAINLAIPVIGREFGSDVYQLSLALTSFLLASAAFLLPLGRLSDILGKRKIFVWGIALFSCSSLLCAFAWSINALILFRILQGAASAMIFATSVSILTLVFSPEERGRVFGINSAAVYIGLSLGPVMGGSITHYWGWRYIFIFTALVSFMVLLLVRKYLQKEWVSAKGEQFDLKGALFYGLGVSALMYGASSLARWSGATVFLGAGLGLLFFFVLFELKTKTPLIQLGIFRHNVTFTFSSLAALISYSATAAVGFLISLHLQIVRGLDAQMAGMVLLCQPVLQALFSPFAGRLSDRVEPRVVASIGMAVTTLGLFCFTFLTAGTPWWFLPANLALLGIGFAFFASPNNNAIMSSVEKKEYGVASAVLGTMRLLGQSLGMALMTFIITLYLGTVTITPESGDLLARSTQVAFLLFTWLCFGGIFASLARGKLNREEAS